MDASGQRQEGFERAMRDAGLVIDPTLVREGNFLPSGERPGETIAVMGYDDQEIAQHLSPALSTVLLPHREMG